jgi:hypothetical protein
MGWLILSAAVVIPLIREDTGIMLIAIGLWLFLREPKRWPIAIALIIWGAGWMVLVTNALMPLFSDDNSKRFMVENFGQYLDVEPSEGASSLSMAQQALSQPLVLLKELVSPPGQTFLYLLGQGLPFLMVPLISLDAWVLAGPSLLGLFLAQGSNDPLSITIRYTLLVGAGLQPGDAALVEPSPASDSRPPHSPGLGHSHQPFSLADRWQQPPSQPVLGGA